MDGGCPFGGRIDGTAEIQANRCIKFALHVLSEFDISDVARLTPTPLIGRRVSLRNALAFTSSNKIVQGNIKTILEEGDQGGELTEGIVEILFTKGTGFTSYSRLGKVGSNNGFDGLFIKPQVNLSGTLAEIEASLATIQIDEIIINESKQVNGSGLRMSSGNGKTGLPKQMTLEWIDNVIGRMDNLGTEEQKKLAMVLRKVIDDNPGKLTRVATGVGSVDGQGVVTLVKIVD